MKSIALVTAVLVAGLEVQAAEAPGVRRRRTGTTWCSISHRR